MKVDLKFVLLLLLFALPFSSMIEVAYATDQFYFHRSSAPTGAPDGDEKKWMQKNSPEYSSPFTCSLTSAGQSIYWYGPTLRSNTDISSGMWLFAFFYSSASSAEVKYRIVYYNTTATPWTLHTIPGITEKTSSSLSDSGDHVDYWIGVSSITIPADHVIAAYIELSSGSITIEYDATSDDSYIMTPTADPSIPVPEVPVGSLYTVGLIAAAALAYVFLKKGSIGLLRFRHCHNFVRCISPACKGLAVKRE